MVRAAQKGEAKASSPEVARVAATASTTDVKKFASTKHKGLPEKKKMNEEGYDHLRDQGKIPPTKGKKDATTMPRSYKPSSPRKGKSALEIVKKSITDKYGKGAIMNLKKEGTAYGIYRGDGKMKIGAKKKEDKNKQEVKAVPADTMEGMYDVDPKTGESPVAASVRKGNKKTGDKRLRHFAKLAKKMVGEETLNERQKDSDNQRLSLERGRSNYGKASIRNMRASGTGGNAADPAERLVAMDARHKAHKEKRGVKTKGVSEGVMGMVKRAAGIKQKPAKKTTGRDAGAIAAKIMRDKEQKKYVGFLPANEEIDRPYTGPDKKDRAVIKKMDNKKFASKLADYEKNMDPKKRQALKDKATKGMKFTHEGIKYDSKGSSMDYFLGADPKKTKEYKALKKKKTQKEGTSYGLYKGSGKPSGAMKKFLDRKAKMLQKKRDSQSDAAKNNPHFDSTQPSPSGRNKYEHVSFKSYFTEGNNTARMLHKSKTSVTGNISADRGGDEKKNQASRKGLEKDLKKKGIGYKKGVGKYKYDSGETGTEVSYQTSKPDKMSKRRFGKTMRRLGRKHGQESVITKDKSKPARLHDTESKKPGKSINIGKSKGGSNPSGMGQTSGDKVRSGKLPSKSKKGAYHYG